MRLCVKKIYCSNCRRLVTAVEPPPMPPYRVLCSKCGMTITVSNGVFWRRGVPGEAVPAREPVAAPATIATSAPPAAPRRPRTAPARRPPARGGEARGPERPRTAPAGPRPAAPQRPRPAAAEKPKAAPADAAPGQKPAAPPPASS